DVRRTLVRVARRLDAEHHRRRTRLMGPDVGPRESIVEVGQGHRFAVAGTAPLEAEIAGACARIRVAAAARGINRLATRAGSPAALLGARAGVEDTAVVQVEVG